MAVLNLGTGGLIRAYGDAAKCTLENCSVEEVIIRDRVRVAFGYEDTSAAMHTIQKYDGKIESSDYHDRTELTLLIRKSEANAFRDAFIDTLRGRGEVYMENEI